MVTGVIISGAYRIIWKPIMNAIIEGEVVSEHNVPNVTLDELRRVRTSFNTAIQTYTEALF